jgi:hypothetical protein
LTVTARWSYENDPEAAWREAQTGGCSDSLWLRLAAAREKEHPEDAGPIYLKQAEAAVARHAAGLAFLRAWLEACIGNR